jgi:flagellar protein FliL
MADEDTAAESKAPGPEPAAAPAKKKPAMLAVIAEVVILTCFAVGAGGLFGMQVLGEGDHKAKPREPAAVPGQKPRYSETASLKPLPAIVTNLAGPKGTWIRIEASIVFGVDTGASNSLAASIAEDIVAYLRTVPLSQVEGPSGFLHLREDLNDRARIRSGGKVRELVIQAMVLE